MKIAYLVNQHPGISHRFMRREIAALERQGAEVARCAVRRSKQGVVVHEDREAAALTVVISAFGLAQARRLVGPEYWDRIIFAGRNSPAEVREAIEGVRAFALSFYAEGRPVISTYFAGIPELVEPGVKGWLAPAGDGAALAAAMAEALDAEDDQILAMGAAGREKTLLRHDIDREAAKLLDHFKALEAHP